MDRSTGLMEVIKRVFSNWTALKMAVEHGMGRPDQAKDFCDYIHQFMLMNEQLDLGDITDELEEYLDTSFNTQLEDESARQVAEELMKFNRYLCENNIQILESEFSKLCPLQPWLAEKNPKIIQTVDSDSDDETPNNMEVDEDGFTLVKRKK